MYHMYYTILIRPDGLLIPCLPGTPGGRNDSHACSICSLSAHTFPLRIFSLESKCTSMRFIACSGTKRLALGGKMPAVCRTSKVKTWGRAEPGSFSKVCPF
jgi:hypothetical protein